MKVFITLLAILLFNIALTAQPYAAGHRTIVFTDASRSNRAIQTEVYYPATSAGNNTALAAGTTSFPVVVFGHGFLIGTGSYEWLADSLVKYGYIVALPATEGGIAPSHGQFGNDLSFLCTSITSLNDSTSSFLYQRVIKRAAVGGHSMGGGSSFLAAAQNNNSITVLFNFAAAETNPSATTAALSVTKPSLVFSGNNDCIAPPSVQQAMYNNLPGCKFNLNISGALHCQFANNNGTCTLGQVFSGCNSSAISTSVLFNKTTSLLLPFLDFYLKNVCVRGNDFDNVYNTITGITKQRSCLPFPSCGVLPVTLLSFSGVIKNGHAELSWKTAAEIKISNYTIERSQNGTAFTLLAKLSPQGINSQGADYFSTDPYPFSGPGFYRIKITENDGSYTYSNVVKLISPQKPFAIIAVYPVPVTDMLTIQLQSDRNQTVTFTLADISGRQLLVQKEVFTQGISSRYLNCSKLSAGTYIVEYKNNETVALKGSFKFIKR